MEPIVYEHRVHYYETDKMNCVHHSNYIRWFEEARTHLMEVCGFGYVRLEELGIQSPVLKVRAEYRSMTRFGETVRIAVKVEEYTGARIRFSYRVEDRETGTLRCLGETEHCFLRREGSPVILKRVCPAYHEAMRAHTVAMAGEGSEEKNL